MKKVAIIWHCINFVIWIKDTALKADFIKDTLVLTTTIFYRIIYKVIIGLFFI